MRCDACDATLDAGIQICGACGASQSAEADDRGAGFGPPGPVADGTAPANGHGRESPGATMTASDLQVLSSDEPNAHYLGQRLLYQSGAETFDASEAVAAGAGVELKASAGAALFVFAAGLVPIGVSYLLSPALFGLGLLVLVFYCSVVLFIPQWWKRNVVVSEWKLMLDGRAEVADAVYDHIAAALVERRAPVEYRAVSLPGIRRRGYLQIRMRPYEAFVTCFAFGRDLYVGWSLWSSIGSLNQMARRGLMALAILPAQLFWHRVNGRPGTFEQSYAHQYDDAKALRECVHSVTREGVEAAIGVVPLRGRGTIGSAIPEGPAPTFVTGDTGPATDLSSL